jgi:extracellular factor (EF) 3-hydroxypalmitic acid methyl ester biosynthesis protein
MPVESPAIQNETRETLVFFQTSQGLELQGTLLKLTRFLVAFEVYSPASALRMSEVLSNFKILINDRPVYSGRAIVSSLVNIGTLLVCEAKLEESWLDVESFVPTLEAKALRAGFGNFLSQWHKIYKIQPEYKGVIADMQTFLADLRIWLDQVELGIRSSPSGDRIQLEQEIARELGEVTTPAIGELFEKFEFITQRVENDQADQRAAHSAFAKRQLHPLLLCSPFLYRTFRKPLGYAGDYEIVNMICRDSLEGSTLFAKIVNLWFLRQAPAEAHRNRIQFLLDRIIEVTARAAHAGRVARIISIGCGPAIEVQRFLAEKEFSDSAQFTLIDFNEETAEHARSVLENAKRKHRRNTQIQVVRKSVHQILKESGRSVERGPGNKYDFVYCAGLFDYLSDQVCHRLSDIMYDWVASGGVFVSTNVDNSNPRRLTMDYIMDWHLIYRSAASLATLKPDAVAAGEGVVSSDNTGANIYYTVRKP